MRVSGGKMDVRFIFIGRRNGWRVMKGMRMGLAYTTSGSPTENQV